MNNLFMLANNFKVHMDDLDGEITLVKWAIFILLLQEIRVFNIGELRYSTATEMPRNLVIFSVSLNSH